MNRLIGIVALGVVAGGLSACGRSEDPPQAKAGEPILVTVAPVATIATTERLEAGGVVAARESASISSRIVATIAGIRLKAGDQVRAGDVLITLDARDVTEHTGQARASAVAAENALTQARTERSAAEAEHRLATAWQKRIATLHARNSATDQERDEAEARLSAAAARLAGTEAGIEGAVRICIGAGRGRRRHGDRILYDRAGTVRRSGDRAPHRSRQSGGTRRPTSQDRV